MILGIWTEINMMDPVKTNFVFSVPKNLEFRIVAAVNGIIAILKI